MFPYCVTYLLTYMDTQNKANELICIFDHEIKGLCPSFNLVPILEAYKT